MTPSAKTRAGSRQDLAYADTNLFVGLLAGPDHALHDPALGVFRRVADGALRLIVTPIVVAELVYVTRSLFAWTRRSTAERLGSLLEANGLAVTEATVIARALQLYREHSRLDFADAYLAAIALELGPATVTSFDSDFDTVKGIRRITS